LAYEEPLISFVYGLVIGSIGSKSYIQMMEQEATDAATVGRIRVIVQSGWLNTSMLQGTTVVVKVGTHGFIHLLFAQILF
jgi:hypothetical protein